MSNVLMTAVEVILMFRGVCVFADSITGTEYILVCALYNGNKVVGLLLLGLMIGKVVATVIGVAITIPGQEYDVHTLLLTTPDFFIYLGYVQCRIHIIFWNSHLCRITRLSSITSQTAIIILTLGKYYSALRSGWSGAPVIALMVRDGSIAFLAIFS